MKNRIKHLLFCILAIVISYNANSQTPDFTGLKIMVNPGHGGHDSDDRGMINGFWESDGNLTKGLWLRDLLEARGAEVVMSRVLNRTEDDLPLSQIAAMANSNNVDLFISIHSNAFNQQVNYPVTIFNGKTETPTIPAAKDWAIVLVNQLILNEATYWTFTTPRYIGDLTLNPGWTNGYGVLWPLSVPGIISEGSFHDYRPEMDRLLNLDYRKQEAWNMLYAMETYFDLPGTEPFGNISGIVRDSLMVKPEYTKDAPDKFKNVDKAKIKLLETGEEYMVDSSQNGFYMFDSIVPGTYTLVLSAHKYLTDTVSVEVLAHKFSYHNHWFKRDTTIAPELLFSTPSEGGKIKCNDPISFTFNMNMDSASVADAFVINPLVPGTFTWDEQYLSVVFHPGIPYETNTLYTATITTAATQKWGINLESDVSMSFTTADKNRYLVDSSFPASSQTEVCPYLQFRLVFDTTLNNTSVIGAVEILPEGGMPIGFKSSSISSVEGKGHFYFSAFEDLEYNKNYTIKLYGTIKDLDGIPLFDTVLIPFSTMEEPVDQLVVDEFEDNEWIIDFDASTGIDPTSFLYKWGKDVRSGEASTLLRAKFTSESGECIFKPESGSRKIITNSHDIGLWIWGDMSNNKMFLGLNNGTEAELCSIDFAGWNYFTIERPIGVTAIEYLKYSKIAGGFEDKDIYIDALSQKQRVGVPTSEADLEKIVYPNPLTGNKLWIKDSKQSKKEYWLYMSTGQLIQHGIIPAEKQYIELDKAVKTQSICILKIKINEVYHSQTLIIDQK